MSTTTVPTNRCVAPVPTANSANMPPEPHETVLTRSMARIVDQSAIDEAARVLICAYAKNPDRLELNDLQEALVWALQGFGLPVNFPDQIHAMIRDQAMDELGTD